MKRGRGALTGLDDEIRNHIDSETQDNIDRGMAPEEARRQALLKFGSVALAKEDTRRVWVWAEVRISTSMPWSRTDSSTRTRC